MEQQGRTANPKGDAMTELKTLKDLTHIKVDRVKFDKSYEGNFYLSTCFSEDELRAEAIKCIKDLDSKGEGFDAKGCSELGIADGNWCCGDGWYNGEVIGQLIHFIKHFFNITDEELK